MVFRKPPKPPKPPLFTRALLLDYIRTHPGDYVSSIVLETGLAPSNANYHLNILEKEGAVVSYQGAKVKRIWPAEIGVPLGPDKMLTNIQTDILANVKRTPGTGYEELARSLGKKHATLAWNVGTLEDMGLVKTLKVRNRVRVYPPQVYMQVSKVMNLNLPGSPPEREELVRPRVKVLSETELDVYAGTPVNIDGHVRIEKGHLTVDLYDTTIENHDDAHVESDIFDDSGRGRKQANDFLSEFGIGPIGFPEVKR